MSQDRFDGASDANPPGNPRSLRQVRAAQLRMKALRWALGKSVLGTVFLIGALTYALSPQRHSDSSRIWMAFLLILSTVNVGLGLRTMGRVRREASRYWVVVTVLWGGLATVLVRFLMKR